MALKTPSLFEEWFEGHRSAIEALIGGRSAPGEGADDFAHSERAAEKLLRETDDLALGQAGLLHAVPPEVLKSSRLEVEPEVYEILEDWSKLLNLRFGDDEAAHDLVANVLPTVQNPKSIILLLVTQLDHLDPEGHLTRWTRQFRRRACRLTRELHCVPSHIRHRQVNDVAGFARNVVAPMAEYWGFWDERNAAQNAALYHENRALFERIVSFAVDCERQRGLCRQQEEAVGRAIDALDLQRWRLQQKDFRVHWEWRHVASLEKQLDPGKSDEDWRENLHQCGFVTVTAPNATACYLLLGALHSALHHRKGSIRDYMGSADGEQKFAYAAQIYSALHTVVVVGGQAIALRIEAGRRPNRTLFKKLAREVLTSQRRELSVYTPAGKRYRLPPGSTVLNFAAALHDDFVALTDHALVNQSDRVGLLHRLRNDDEVQLVLAEAPRALPRGWENAVPVASVPGINKRYRRAMRRLQKPYYRGRGVAFLLEQLAARGCYVSTASIPVAELVGGAAELCPPQQKQRSETPAEWWLVQLGRWESQRRGHAGTALHVDAPLVDHFVRTVVYVLNRTYQATLDEFELPQELRDQADSIVQCSTCRPTGACEIVATMNEGALVVHRANAPCARRGVPVQRQRRFSEPRYFEVQSTNQVGVAAAILEVFRRAGVDVVEVVGRRLGTNWWVMRIETGALQPEMEQALPTSLRALPEVTHVSGPEDPPTPAVEGALPPRRSVSREPLWVRPSPYRAQGVLTNDDHFYGRDRELRELLGEFQRTLGKDAVEAATVFICGPLKVGKSSLALKLARTAPQLTPRPCLTVYREAAYLDNWGSFAPLVRDELLDQLAQLQTAGTPLPRTAPRDGEGPESKPPLYDVLADLRRRHPRLAIILILDEFTEVLYNTGRDPEQIREFLRFWGRARTIPGLMAVFVGPHAPLRGEVDATLTERFLRWVKQLQVGPLSSRDSELLLRAANLGAAYEIRLKSRVATEAWRRTGGNAYWLQALGSKMWSARASSLPTYDLKALNKAQEDLAADTIYFVDRLRRGNDSHRQLIRVLAEASGPASDDVPWVPVGQLADRLPPGEPLGSREALLGGLQGLRDWGVIEVDGAPQLACRFAAPILKRAVLAALSLEGNHGSQAG